MSSLRDRLKRSFPSAPPPPSSSSKSKSSRHPPPPPPPPPKPKGPPPDTQDSAARVANKAANEAFTEACCKHLHIVYTEALRKDECYRKGKEYIPGAGTGLTGLAVVELLTGTKMIHRMLEMFDSFLMPDGSGVQLKRTAYQIKYHKDMITAWLGAIYGPEFDTYFDDILRYWDITDYSRFYAVLCSRRDGKSWTVAMIESTLSYVFPTFGRAETSNILSTGKRISGEMKTHFLRFFYQLPDAHSMVAMRNSEKVIINLSGDPDDLLSFTINILPCNPDKVRGIGGAINIVDEAGFTDNSTFTDVINPLSLIARSGVVCLSSPPKDTSSFYYSLFGDDPPMLNGRPVWKTDWRREICDECMEDGLMTCVHMKEIEEAPWKGKHAREQVQANYGHDPEKYRREACALLETSDIAVFRPRLVNAWAKRPTYTFTYPPDFLFNFIDPSPGGIRSNTAILTGAFTEFGELVIIGGEDIAMREGVPRKECELLATHLTDVQQYKHFLSIIWVFGIERVSDFISARALSDTASKFTPRKFIIQGDDPLLPPGFTTKDEDKIGMAALFVDMLRTNKIYFHEPFITRTEGLKDLILSQVRNYAFVTEEAKKPEFTEVKRAMSGKRQGKRDDQAMVVQMMTYWGMWFLSNPAHTYPHKARVFKDVGVIKLTDNPKSKRVVRVTSQYTHSDEFTFVQKKRCV